MKKKPTATAATAAGAARLRRNAEKRLRSHAPAARPAADNQRLLHEVQVHQVELEMQNAALQEARDRVEALLEKYTDLYDFAPVGYFSLDEEGRILEANLTGAALLGVDRTPLINRRFPRFVAPASQAVFLAFLAAVFAGTAEQVCEAALLKQTGEPFWANIHGAPTLSVRGPRRWCRVAVSDITTLKHSQEAHRRMEALTVTNRELQREIIRRQAVEDALTASEQHQTQLLEQSRAMQDQLRHLSHRILQAQEEERKRISRELHDEITQTLVGINVHLETLVRDAQGHPDGFKQKIARTQRLVEKSVHIVHQFARELRPTALDDLGLISTLHSFLKEFTKRTGIRVGFKAFAAVDQLESASRIVLYRVVQSALTNVAQHAQASRVTVSLRELPGAVRLEIADNGKSFDVEPVMRVTRHKRLGLISMRERLEMVGGSFAVKSAPDHGTTVIGQIPFVNRPARTTGPAGDPGALDAL